MSADRQHDSPLPAQDTLQARLDYLFRHHPRADADGAATGVLRRCIEQYRLQEGQQTGDPA